MPRRGTDGYPRPVTSPTRAPRRPRAPARAPTTRPHRRAPPTPRPPPPAKAAPGRGGPPARRGPRRRSRRDPRPARRRRRRGGPPARRGRRDGLPGRPGHRPSPVRPRRGHPEPAQPGRVRSIDLPVGVGLFGRSVAERAVVLTSDYLADASFDHAPETDRVVADLGIRSMVAAPLVAGGYGLRGDGHLLVACRRVQPRADRPGPCAGRSRGGGDAQRPAHRGARRLPDGARQARRRRAVAARDRGADQRRGGLPGGGPARRRRGCPAARRRRRPDRPDRWRAPASCSAPTPPGAPLDSTLGSDDPDATRQPLRRGRPGGRHLAGRTGPATTSTTRASADCLGADNHLASIGRPLRVGRAAHRRERSLRQR